MKSIVFLLGFSIGLVNQVNGQFFTRTDTVDWKAIEKDYSDEYKIEQIKLIEEDPIKYMYSEYESTFDQHLPKFHFLDYNIDGQVDIIFSGTGVWEGTLTLIFELQDGKYVTTVDLWGEIIEVKPLAETGVYLYSFLLFDQACCGGYTQTFELYSPVYIDGVLKLKSSTKFTTIYGTEWPSDFFSEPKLFEVKRETYNLRFAPEVDEETEFVEFHMEGNVIGEYAQGARGYALAQKEDETGRVWWFVYMVSDQIDPTMFEGGKNNENSFFVIGWMSSSYLKVIE